MNSVALNNACATSIASPASAVARVPTLTTTREEPELADGPVGQQQLEVVLTQRPQAAEHHRDDAQREQQPPPPGDVGERGSEERHEVDAGLHHRGRVEVGADRGRRRHRGGEPEVEREQRRLADRAEQHEEDPDRHGRTGRRVGHDLGDPEGARLDPDEKSADQQREAAEGRDDERLQGGGTAGSLGGVLTDEEVGEDRRQLPEHVEQEQVVGEDQAEHRPGEADEDAGEQPEPRAVVGEVPGAVDQDEGADAGDDEHHHPLQRPHREREVEIEDRHPAGHLGRHLRVGDPAARGQRPPGGGSRDEREQEEGAPAERADQPRGDERSQEVREHQGYQLMSSRRPDR
ncbi:hypothetical protein [Nocardioides sp. TF02-7]|uniref:hypothetical protein n=1 Tax=Nocardioides sp. TF02-7 TaxID=2917724 RepID=UPI001F0602ED|nr:hypothetical protein [Nocardioides sp. TF02-7]UMG92764.1 hypothetical protein MF408_24170 [Nocardioides sp. TF02-7]